MSHRAQTETKTAYLSDDFGRDYAMRTFGLTLPEIEAIVGRYTKGQRKGRLRGALRWRKCIRGGWYATGPSAACGERTAGHVKRPGDKWDFAIVDPWKLAANGEPVKLWTTTHKEWGWIPGETREQFEARQKAKSEALRAELAALSPAELTARLDAIR